MIPDPYSFNMDKAKMIEITKNSQQAAADAVALQIEKGAPNRGMPKARHVAVVAYVVQEILGSHVYSEGLNEAGVELEQKEVLRAIFSGSLLNASQFRQELEKAGMLEADTPMKSQYDC